MRALLVPLVVSLGCVRTHEGDGACVQRIDPAPGACAPMTPEQVIDLALQVAEAHVVVELPCIEVVP